MHSGRPGLADIEAAAGRIRDLVRPTPLVEDEQLGVYLKAECLQETGSFKVRGAANALLSLSDESRSAGVVAVSSGNHGRAVAFVAKTLGIPATICLSSRVPEVKVEAIRNLGARIEVAGPTQDEAYEAALQIAGRGATFIHPFDDPRVISGQGTLGLEIVQALPWVESVVVPLSGGGLISGIAIAVSGRRPGAAIVGASQDRGPAMHDSLQAGHLVDVIEEDTLADALAGGLGEENQFTFEICRDLVNRTVLVSEEQIASAMRYLYEEQGWRVEGGGAVGVAAVQAGLVELPTPTVVVVSGGNVSDETLFSVLAA